MKLLAIDPGDRWIGVAISDPLGIVASPYKTVELKDLEDFLKETISKEGLKKIIVGYPKTLRGTESEQTKKVKALTQKLKETFPDIEFVLWDERLTSKQVEKIKKLRTKEDKIKSHSVAAAFILHTYLEFLNFQKH